MDDILVIIIVVAAAAAVAVAVGAAIVTYYYCSNVAKCVNVAPFYLKNQNNTYIQKR